MITDKRKGDRRKVKMAVALERRVHKCDRRVIASYRLRIFRKYGLDFVEMGDAAELEKIREMSPRKVIA